MLRVYDFICYIQTYENISRHTEGQCVTNRHRFFSLFIYLFYFVLFRFFVVGTIYLFQAPLFGICHTSTPHISFLAPLFSLSLTLSSLSPLTILFTLYFFRFSFFQLFAVGKICLFSRHLYSDRSVTSQLLYHPTDNPSIAWPYFYLHYLYK